MLAPYFLALLGPVIPGLRLHFTPPAATDTVIYRRTVTRAGRDSASGTRTVVLRTLHGSPALLEVEQRFPGGGGTIIDTAIAELATLRAVAHRSHQPARTMRLDFASQAVSGSVSDSAGPVRQELGGAIFDSNLIELVVAALPLKAGFSRELPFFIFERGGRVMLPVTVRDRATLDGREVWVVSVGVPGAPATVWVDAKEHVALRVRYDIPARELSFTDERVTPVGR